MNDIAYLLGQESVSLEQLIAALKDEQSALKSGMADALAPIIDRKNRLLEALVRTGRRRNELLKQAGFAADREGISAWGSASTQQPLALGFLTLANEARELNRLNGQLIALRLQATQAALETLTPNRPGQGLYGPSGITSFSTGYRLIDSA